MDGRVRTWDAAPEPPLDTHATTRGPGVVSREGNEPPQTGFVRSQVLSMLPHASHTRSFSRTRLEGPGQGR